MLNIASRNPHLLQLVYHRRRMKTEEKAKVVAAVWGTEFMEFLATLAIFHQNDFQEKDE